MCNNMCTRQVPVRDGAYMARCQRAAAAVARAAAMLPDEWAYEVWAGKLAGKAGAPLSTVLRRCTASCITTKSTTGLAAEQNALCGRL